MNIKSLFKRLIVKYFPRFAGKYFLNDILNSQGIKVGRHTIFYNPETIIIDRTRPWMLEIGDYCKVCRGVTILAHDYSRSVFRRSHNIIIGESGITRIGDNVFIGINSLILMGTKIGNNVIVGGGSVVSGVIPDNVVIAGNPARIIRSLDEHVIIRKKRLYRDAYEYINSFINAYHRYPSVRELGPFFTIFVNRHVRDVEKYKINLRWNGDNEIEILNSFLLDDSRQYKSIEDFIDDYKKCM